MRLEIENISRIIKHQATIKGPKLIRRGLSDGIISVTAMGIELSNKFSPNQKEEKKK